LKKIRNVFAYGAGGLGVLALALVIALALGNKFGGPSSTSADGVRTQAPQTYPTSGSDPRTEQLCIDLNGKGYPSDEAKVFFRGSCTNDGRAAQGLAPIAALNGGTATGSTGGNAQTGGSAKSTSADCGYAATAGFINKAGPVTVNNGCSIYGWYTVTVNGKVVNMDDEKAKTTVVATCDDVGGCPVNVKYDGGTRIISDPSTAKCGSGTDCTAVYYAKSLSKEATARSNGSTTTTPTLQAQTTTASNVSAPTTTASTSVSTQTTTSTANNSAATTVTTATSASTAGTNPICPYKEPKYIPARQPAAVPAGCTAYGYLMVYEKGLNGLGHWEKRFVASTTGKQTVAATFLKGGSVWPWEGGAFITAESARTLKNNGCPEVGCSIMEMSYSQLDKVPLDTTYDSSRLYRTQDQSCGPVSPNNWTVTGKAEDGFRTGSVGLEGYNNNFYACQHLSDHLVNQQGLPQTTNGMLVYPVFP
jgi:hypothetical protein